MRIVLMWLVAVMMISCSMAQKNKTNIIEVRKGEILAQGEPTRDGERLNVLTIDLQRMSSDGKTNLWVEFPDNQKFALSAITMEEVKSRSTKEWQSPDSKTQKSFDVGGYWFEFDGNTLISLSVSKYGRPPTQKIAFTRIGSFSSNASLSLPCTLGQFEEVFGKADQIKRWWSW